MRHDLGSVLRRVVVRPWLPVISIALLGTATGLHTAIFAAVDMVLLQPLPFHDPDRLVLINEAHARTENGPPDRAESGATSVGNFRDLQRATAASTVFAAIGAYVSVDAALLGGDTPQSLSVIYASSSMFDVLATPPARGRVYTAQEEDGRAPVLMLSDSGWTRYFGRDEHIVGSRIELDGVGYTIIGIAAPQTGRILRADILRPLSPPRSGTGGGTGGGTGNGRGERVLQMFGRLATGATPAMAQEAMSGLVAQLEPLARENQGFRAATITPLRDHLVAGVRGPIIALEILSLFIIIVVAANLVGLQFARLEWRARELAIRAALGASRRRLIGEALIESLAIAIAALAVGLVTASWMIAIGKATLLAPDVLQPLRLDSRAIAVAAGVALAVGLGSGMCSVLMLITRDLSPLLMRASTALGPGRLTQRAQALVVITQTALALIFIVVAFTVIGEVARLMRVDPGFRTESLWTVDIKTQSGARGPGGGQGQEYTQILDALRALPGVDAAGATNEFPLLGNPVNLSLRVRDVPIAGGERVQFRMIMPGYFETLGVPLRAGRAFATSDDRSKGTAALVAIVNQAFADRYWPGADPLGRDVAIASSPWLRVIGVVANVRSIALTEPPVPELYVSMLQVSNAGEMTLVLRTHPGTPLSASAVRAAIQTATPTVAVTRMAAVDTRLAEQRQPQRFSAAFLSVLALLAMALAAAGTYSLVAYAVASRTREIAIRRILGAGDAHIKWRMASHAAVAITIGTACGVAAIVALTRVYKSMLFTDHPVNPAIVTIAALVLIVLSVLASYVPVQRAMHRPLREVLQSE